MTEQSEREALEALFADLHGTKDSIPLHRYTIKWRDRRDRFTTMLDAGAYLNAVLMCVPEGWGYVIHKPSMPDPDNPPSARVWGPRRDTIGGSGLTPALALCEAIKAAKDKPDA